MAGRRARPRPSSASSASPRRDRWVPASLDLEHRPRQLPQGPDLQHAGAGHDLPRRASRSSGSTTTAAWSSPRAAATARPRSSTPGPRPGRYATPFVADPAKRSHVVGHHRPRRAHRRHHRVARAAGQRHRRHRVATASSAATSCGSPCSRPSTPTTSRRSPRCIDHVVDRARLTPSGDRRRSALSADDDRAAAIRTGGMAMPTTAEVRAQLTGPGGPFEVVTDVVDGVEMKVYKDRLPHLRAVAELAADRGATRTVHRLRRPAHRLRRVLPPRQLGVGRAGRDARGRPRRPGGRAVGQQPRVVPRASGPPSTSAAILVGLNGWWKTDEILYGLQDSGAKVLVADRGASSASPTSSTSSRTSKRVFLIDADPAEFGGDPRLHRFDELTGRRRRRRSPTRRSTRATPRSSSTRAGTTGRPKGAISTHRNMIANLQNTIFNTVAAAMAGPETVRPLGGGGPDRRRC